MFIYLNLSSEVTISLETLQLKDYEFASDSGISCSGKNQDSSMSASAAGVRTMYKARFRMLFKARRLFLEDYHDTPFLL